MQIQKDKCFNIKAFRVEVVELKYIISVSITNSLTKELKNGLSPRKALI